MYGSASLQLFPVVWLFLRSLGVICYERWVLGEGHKNYSKDWCLMQSQSTFLFLTYLTQCIMATGFCTGVENMGRVFKLWYRGKGGGVGAVGGWGIESIHGGAWGRGLKYSLSGLGWFLAIESHFKVMKTALFYLKSSIRSEDIQLFVLNFLVM